MVPTGRAHWRPLCRASCQQPWPSRRLPASILSQRARHGPTLENCPDASAASGSGGLRALAVCLDTALPPLAAEFAALSARADAELSEQAGGWAPVAAELASWCADAAAARDAAVPVAALKDTEQWLKAAVDDIRNARLAPLADQAREIWGLLRRGEQRRPRRDPADRDGDTAPAGTGRERRRHARHGTRRHEPG